MSASLEVLAIAGLPEITPGDHLGALLAARAWDQGIELADADVVVISQKVVSKAEGRVRDLAQVEPGERARELAAAVSKDPRLVELILAESSAIVRASPGVLIVATRQGWVCANAGIDASNVPGPDRVTLLPADADASARRIRAEVRDAAGVAPAVIVADSFGRAWRLGQVEVAIGCAGIRALDDWRGLRDREGKSLAATSIAVADEAAAAADLVRDKSAGLPAAVVRGLGRYVTEDDGPGAGELRRAAEDDLFR